ncbi:hypothetical protein BSL78_13758 [Apostichopus japonicus]|uniref:Uncharacterized protein n=1 Tax=Stichopus japonicus TaxID=307972 RepID=A0A2G8KN55_STIJA|nr:hypothetical protein BSL78_13758 [Apostichopus japonicus]
MDSIFSPLVYARIDRYSEAYTALTCGPCRLCGHTQTFPHGLTASEIKRITKRLALEGCESPGINMRNYSRRGHERKPKPCNVIIEGSCSEVTGISTIHNFEEKIKSDEEIWTEQMKFEHFGCHGEIRRRSDSGYTGGGGGGLSLRTDFSSLKRSTSDTCLNEGFERTSSETSSQRGKHTDGHLKELYHHTIPQISITSLSSLYDVIDHNFESAKSGYQNGGCNKTDNINTTSIDHKEYGSKQRKDSDLSTGENQPDVNLTKSTECQHRESEIKTSISSGETNMTVLLQTRVESPGIRLQLELLSSSGLISHYKEESRAGRLVEPSSQRSPPSFEYSRSHSVDYSGDGAVQLTIN